jgi:hypothetical protein
VSKNAEVQFAIPKLEAGIATTQEITALASTLEAGPLSHYVHLFPQINRPNKLASIVQARH